MNANVEAELHDNVIYIFEKAVFGSTFSIFTFKLPAQDYILLHSDSFAQGGLHLLSKDCVFRWLKHSKLLLQLHI